MIYLDSNVLIALVEGAPPTQAQIGMVEALADRSLVAATSELSLAECLVKPYRERNAAAVAAFLEFMSGRPEVRMLPVTRAILMRAARVRSETLLKLPDAIHLVSAIEAGCEALVTDDGDFPRAGEMKIVGWAGFDIGALG